MLRRKSAYQRKIHRYLRTKTWAARSLRFRTSVGFRCASCGTTYRRNHAHHLTYQRAFHGREPSSDLLCLCPPCHRAVHAYARAHPALSLRRATFRALSKLGE
jgi:predicted HNH restriction endonuclease